jgi:hypothetical protein
VQRCRADTHMSRCREWLARQVRGEDEPAWVTRLAEAARRGIAEMNAWPKADAGQMLHELQEAADRIEKRRAGEARRREAERRSGEQAWERAMAERYGRVPVAASARWWDTRLRVSIW